MGEVKARGMEGDNVDRTSKLEEMPNTSGSKRPTRVFRHNVADLLSEARAYADKYQKTVYLFKRSIYPTSPFWIEYMFSTDSTILPGTDYLDLLIPSYRSEETEEQEKGALPRENVGENDVATKAERLRSDLESLGWVVERVAPYTWFSEINRFCLHLTVSFPKES